MKYVFILILTVFYSSCCCQVDIINLSLTDSSLNIFYIGADNYIKLKANSKISEYTIAVKGAGSRIWHEEQDRYLIGVDHPDTCRVIITRNGNQVLVRKYDVKLISSVMLATIGGFRDTTMKKSRILANPFLTIVIPNCYYRHPYYISKFEATFIYSGESISTITSGKQLSIEQLEIIKRLNPGDEIKFEHLYVGCPYCRNSTAPPFWIKIE